MLRIVQIAMLLVIVVGSTLWLVQDLDWSLVLATLGSAHPLFLLGVIGFLLVGHLARSLRIGVLVRASVTTWDLVRISAVSFLAIQLVPFRLGEFVRPQLLVRYGVPFGEGVAAIAVDRLLDVLMLLVLMAVVTFTVPLPSGAITVDGIDVVAAGQQAASALVVGGMIGFVAVATLGSTLETLVARVPVVGEVASRLVGSAVASFRHLAGAPATATIAIGWSVVSWLSSIAMLWCAQQAFDGVPLDLATTLVLTVAIVTAMSAIHTPGFFGPFEAGAVAALLLYGTTPSVAKAFALALHLTMFAFTVTIAIGAMLSLQLSFEDLRPRAEAADQSKPR